MVGRPGDARTIGSVWRPRGAAFFLPSGIEPETLDFAFQLAGDGAQSLAVF